jgi:hypothetical protein
MGYLCFPLHQTWLADLLHFNVVQVFTENNHHHFKLIPISCTIETNYNSKEFVSVNSILDKGWAYKLHCILWPVGVTFLDRGGWYDRSIGEHDFCIHNCVFDSRWGNLCWVLRSKCLSSSFWTHNYVTDASYLVSKFNSVGFNTISLKITLIMWLEFIAPWKLFHHNILDVSILWLGWQVI